MAAELGADEKLLRRWLVKLDNLHLVELRARLGARLRVHAPISWREDGPIRRTYEQQVRDEFMRSGFQAQDEALHFRSAELSEASRMVLQRKLARLTADFNELAELDRHLPQPRETQRGAHDGVPAVGVFDVRRLAKAMSDGHASSSANAASHT